MSRRPLSLAMLLALQLSSLLPTAARAADAPLPDSIAAVGDSITRAASTGGTLGADYPANSWSTGTNSTVNSHYLRLLAAGAPISGRNYNRAVSGAKVLDLNAQMANVVTLTPDYVTVLIGGNDLCTDTVAQMTSVADFRSRFATAMSTLAAGSPETSVYVVSIPNVYQLWNLFRNNFTARFIWALAGICQSLLANPGSTQAADVQRRETVRQRNIDFNTQLSEVCASFDRCHFDGNAVFNTTFTSSDVSGDYFHPSISGQAKLAAVSWAAGFTWTSPPPPPPPNESPIADFGFACVELTCSFTDASTDDAGIATRTWAFGDGAGSTSANPSHAYAAAGTYTVTLTVTDAAGLTDASTKSVIVTSETSLAPMFIDSLAGSSESTGRNTWTATVTIRVVDGDAHGVQGAVVFTAWSVGAADTCTTGADGTCSVTSDSLHKKKVAGVTATVTDVTHLAYAYGDGPVTTAVARP
jgi:PKD repeat protein